MHGISNYMLWHAHDLDLGARSQWLGREKNSVLNDFNKSTVFSVLQLSMNKVLTQMLFEMNKLYVHFPFFFQLHNLSMSMYPFGGMTSFYTPL